jgi:hypothetical protein
MATTTTTTPTALEALDTLDRTAIKIGRRMEEVREQLMLVGHRGRPGNPAAQQHPVTATGRIAATLREIATDQRLAAREGEAADTSKLDAELKALGRQSEDLGRELAAVSREQQTIGYERLAVIRDQHDGFAKHARAVAAEAGPLWDTLAAAARDVSDHRIRAQQAIALASAGHPGARPGATTADEQDRKTFLRSFEPITGATPAIVRLWESVAHCSSGPKAAV